MIVYGRHPVLEYLSSKKDVEKVLLQKNIDKDFFYRIQSLCKERSIPVQIVPKEKLNRTTRKNHQGIIAFTPLIQFYNLQDVIPHIFEKNEVPLILILDNITDVRNFGSVARSAECFGVHAIVVPDQGSAPVNEISIKTSAGALSRLQVCKVRRLAEAIAYLQNSGIQVFATSLNASKTISALDLREPTAIILGSEDQGVQKYLLKSADELFIIPQIGETDSLNVSVANGIILYEVLRQRSL
ncbi:MAG: 23S rRNA (guanosine(2251)-2'-O)-methyltransferase RlmB [Bacteroidia bacterium]|nr:23S rRNA (guanosine(2251)-2'-O)-methyltransferase RlmB [Bacteroidia bacterium]